MHLAKKISFGTFKNFLGKQLPLDFLQRSIKKKKTLLVSENIGERKLFLGFLKIFMDKKIVWDFLKILLKQTFSGRSQILFG